jgi:hypothetical protein
MRASISTWPYRPSHITNDGEDYKQEDVCRLVGVGIISHEYVQGVQSSISGDLGYPTSVVEFPPGLDSRPVHTDSKLVAPYGIRPACEELRGCTNCRLCHECDDAHALLFRGLHRSNLGAEIGRRLGANRYLGELPAHPYIMNWLHDRERERAMRTVDGGEYFEYDCWLLGLRELIFPIFFEDAVVGVFFTGQICLDWKLELIQRRHRELLSSNLDCYVSARFGKDNLLSQSEKEHILDIYRNWFQENQHQVLLTRQ